jgi:heme a synthase
MVIIGGITRLTQSGLSMVKWEPIMGTLPPMSQDAWNAAFDMYKQTPEFDHYNADFALSDFKSIFFWEYLHRLIARILGLIFIIPCIIFWVKKYFTPRLKRQIILIFIFGALQGVLGWVMVKSGLVDQPHVSHYRLAAHLITALGLLVYIYWVAISMRFTVISPDSNNLRKIVGWFIGLVFFQIIYGAFVAGLKAGLYYTTFPKMGSQWVPSEFGVILKEEGAISLMESPGLVQFVHRIVAFIIVILLGVIWMKSRKNALSAYQRFALNLLSLTVLIQFMLGIVTLLYAVPVVLGVSHQFGAILVLLASFFFLFTLRKSNIKIISN